MEIPPLKKLEPEDETSRTLNANSVRKKAGRSRVFYCASAMFALFFFVGGLLWLTSGRDASEIVPVLIRAERAPFVHEILVQGNVQSSVNTEVECEVEWHDNWWPVILDVVEEGTFVEEGDLLMRIDTSKLSDLIRDSEAKCRDMEAWKVRASSRLAVAHMDIEAFEDGRRELELTRLRSVLAQAEQELKEADRDLELTEQLYARGYLTENQLEATQLAAKLAQNEWEAASLGVEILGTYTHARERLELQSEISAAEENLSSAEEILRIVVANHEELLAELDKCDIYAPIEGYVVLNHLHHSDHSHWIKMGEKIRPGQTVIKLPDPRFMQVEAYLSESETPIVKEGHVASMTFDAYPGLVLPGVVESVSSFAEEMDRFGPNIKMYKTIITIDRAEVERTGAPLRPGLTARVDIIVDSASPCLQIPFQAVFQHGEEDFCLTYEDGRIDSRRIDTVRNNGMFVVVRSGLEEGESIVMGADLYRDEVELPPLIEVEDIPGELPELELAARTPSAEVETPSGPSSPSQTPADPSSIQTPSGPSSPSQATLVEPASLSSQQGTSAVPLTGHASP